MKKCLYCENECDDNFLFCPECGKRLDGRIPCKKCGNPTPADAKFCVFCGARTDGKVNCPNCHTELDEGVNFCPICGEDLRNNNEETPFLVANKKPVVAKKVKGKSNVHSLVCNIALIVLSSLLIIGIFAPFYVQSFFDYYEYSSESYSLINCIGSDRLDAFLDVVEYIDQISAAQVIILIFPVLLALVAIPFIMTYAIISIIKSAKALARKERKVVNKHFAVAAVFYFASILAIAISVGGTVTIEEGVSGFSGYVYFLVTLLVLYFAADKVFKMIFVDRKANAVNIVLASLKFVSIIFTVVLGMQLCGAVVEVYEYGISSFYLAYTDYYMFGETLITSTLLILINMTIVVLFAVFLVKKLISDDNKSMLGLTIVELSMVVAYALLGLVFAKEVFTSDYYEISVGLSGAIVLAVLQLGLGITHKVFLSKK